MNPARFANRELPTPDRAECNGTAGLAIHTNWCAEGLVSRAFSEVGDVGRARISMEVDEMDDAFGIDDSLRLQSVLGSLDHLTMLLSSPAHPLEIEADVIKKDRREIVLSMELTF